MKIKYYVWSLALRVVDYDAYRQSGGKKISKYKNLIM